jgi:hypothetical protein
MHEIKTNGQPLIPQRPYTINNSRKKEFLKNELDRMLKFNLIQESKSPFVSPVVFVEKKKKETLGEYRLCQDYRRLNKITIRDQYPLPKIRDILNNFKGASYFTTLDLASGFYQVEMKPEHRELTAFTTEFGNFEFLVMPFGLMNAPLTFQRLVDKVFNQ